MNSIQQRVTKSISEQLGVDPALIHLDSHLIDDLGADSLDLVESTMLLEEEFNCVLTIEEMDNLHTVFEIVDYLENRL